MQGAHQRQALALLSQAWKQFADIHAGHGGANGTKRPAIFQRRVRLGIERLELARSAPHPEQDHRRWPRALVRLSGQELRQSESAECE